MNPYQKIIDFLKENSISYAETEHEPVFTSDQAAKVRGEDINIGAKSLLIKAGGNFVMVVLPGGHKLDSKKLKNVLNVKDLRFALPEEVEKIMGCKIGACYPFGNIIGLATYADNTLMNNEKIVFNPGLHDHSIEIKWSDFLKNVHPIMADIS